MRTTACVQPPSVCRSGFTREYGGGGNGERRVEIGQQVRPFRG
ncbi:diguanylate phosphodiesterase [Pseudomonas sp. SWI36]|nr:diguanylate phosphodiesterase [Pseudomonas sp. SWI36]